MRSVGMSDTFFPLLKQINYPGWLFLLKVIMEARHMWQAIETGDVEFAKDRLAMEAILRSMPQEMLPILASNNTAKEACDTSKTLHICVDHLHE